MKKSNAINLVLITAAMAACNRPLYQQRPDGYEDPGYSADATAGPLTAGPDSGLTAGPGSRASADAADSTNSCPVESSELPPDYYDWYNGTGALWSITVDFNINGFYAYRNPAPLVRVNPVRSFFARAFANIRHPMAPNRVAPYPMENRPASVHNTPASTRPTVARSGFGARAGMAVHS
jgi:hypothetical protein